MPTKKKSLPCKSGSKKRGQQQGQHQGQQPNLRKIRALHRQRSYRRNSMMLAANSTARNARRFFYLKRFAPRIIRCVPNGRQNAAKWARENQACVVTSLRSIRRIILWFEILEAVRASNLTRKCLFCGAAL